MRYDLAIIGGGPAGYTAAEEAGKNGLRTILFEKNALGGVCLNEGCIPTKTLLYSAKVYNTVKEAGKYAVSCDNAGIDLAKIIARKNKIVRKLTAGIRGKLSEAGVEVVTGEAVVEDAGAADALRVLCNGEYFEAARLLICSGSEAVVPPIAGIDLAEIWTSREALDNKEVPESLVIIGGGVIGIEFASFFNALGTKVVVVEMLDEILGGMDGELSALLRAELAKKGVVFYLNTKVVAISGGQVEIENENGRQLLDASKILVSVGRRPAAAAYGLEMFRNGLKVNEFMQTSNPRVYACGDVTGVSLLAHTAVREAEIAVGHILGQTGAMSYRAIPAVVYTNPELAGVGRTEEALREAGIPYTVRKLPLTYSGRFVAENELGSGVCKLLEGTDGTILGTHILGNPASELIVIAGIFIEKGMTVDELKAVVFPHPTVGEIMKETANLHV